MVESVERVTLEERHFTAALGPSRQWQVPEYCFEGEAKRRELQPEYVPREHFECPQLFGVHDMIVRRCRH
jgi:hypothetical protein